MLQRLIFVVIGAGGAARPGLARRGRARRSARADAGAARPVRRRPPRCGSTSSPRPATSCNLTLADTHHQRPGPGRAAARGLPAARQLRRRGRQAARRALRVLEPGAVRAARRDGPGACWPRAGAEGMAAMPAPAVLISEVGPRDGLQSVERTMPTADKFAWIDALHAAGLREIEVGSFVPAKLLPQMADAAEVVRHARTLPGLDGDGAGAQPARRDRRLDRRRAQAHGAGVGERGAFARQRAQDARADGRRGACHRRAARRACAASRGRGRHLHRVRLHAAGRGRRGRRDPAGRRSWWPAGADEVGLSDTTGMANPAQVRRLFTRAARRDRRAQPAPRTCTTRAAWAWPTAWPPTTSACAPSTPRSAASAAAPMRRARRATSSPRTWSSCSRRWACATGVDLDRLIAARAPLQAGLPGEPLYGMTPEAGLPHGLRYARRGATSAAHGADARDTPTCRWPACASSSSPTW